MGYVFWGSRTQELEDGEEDRDDEPRPQKGRLLPGPDVDGGHMDGSMRWSSYNAAGKTGSAQYDNSDNVHSWFVGFAPAETPEIVVSVVLEGGYSGVSSAQYIAKAVFDAYFQ